MAGWARPHKRFKAAPHDAWLMSQPVSFAGRHVWVADTGVYTVPEYRIAGITAPVSQNGAPTHSRPDTLSPSERCRPPSAVRR